MFKIYLIFTVLNNIIWNDFKQPQGLVSLDILSDRL